MAVGDLEAAWSGWRAPARRDVEGVNRWAGTGPVWIQLFADLFVNLP
jgi:hypothetical protein